MDNSFIELLKSVGNQINHTELNAAINADNFDGEFALSEDGLTSAKTQVSKLFTLESAINNQEVIERISKDLYPKHMKSSLSKVEGKLKPLYDKLGIDYSEAEFLSDKIGDLEEKITQSASKGDNKEVIETLNKELRDAKAALDTKDEEFNLKIQERDSSYLAERLKDKFTLSANQYKWADAYSDTDLKKAILNQKWDKLNAKAHLKLSDDGNILLMQKDFPDKELYNGNKLETFQSLLEPELEPYLQKSDPKKVNKSEPKPREVEGDLTPNQKSMMEQRAKFN